MRRLLGLVATAALMGGSIALAVPAHAADVTATCDTPRTFNVTVALGGTYEIAVGTGCTGRAMWTWNMPTTQSGVTATLLPATTNMSAGVFTNVAPPNDSVRITNTSGSPTAVVVSIFAGLSNNGQEYFITFSGSGGGGASGGSSSGAGSAPAPVVQEFGTPASGTCDAAASEDLNWAGVTSGGWSTSWAEWMNGGTGGAVCTRTLFYDTQASAWSVRT